MKTTEPKLEDRAALPYAGIRSQVAMDDFPNIIPQQVDEVAGWLEQQGVAPAGAPIIRYHACPTVMEGEAMLDVTIGFPVASALAGDERVTAGTLPAGRYASLVFTGVENGVPGNGMLIDWAKAQGIRWDSWDVPDGEGFAGRVEHMIDGPEDDPDPSNWRTEVSIRLADDSPIP